MITHQSLKKIKLEVQEVARWRVL